MDAGKISNGAPGEPHACQVAIVVRFPDTAQAEAEEDRAAAAITQRPISELVVPFLVREESPGSERYVNRLMLAVATAGVLLVLAVVTNAAFAVTLVS